MWNTKWKCGKINIRKELCELVLNYFFVYRKLIKYREKSIDKAVI